MILFVDDHGDTAEFLCRILGKQGYPCESAADGREALARIRAHPPEQPLLVVLDHYMPMMSGLDVLREIRQDPGISKTAVMMYSAGYDVAARDEAITLGAVAWQLKGAGELEDFLNSVKHHYERVGGVASLKKGAQD